jgi:TatD DNase family protein
MISSLKENGLETAVQVSTEPEIFDWSYEFAKRNEGFLFTLGIHPSTKAEDKDLAFLSDFVKKVIEDGHRNMLFGIGETGLDYYRLRQPKNMQVYSFEYQIDLAIKNDIPVIIHSRDALQETLEILKAKRPRGLMHCFSGDSKAAKEFLDIGFYISFAGNLTYNKAHELHDAAKYVPMDRVMLETDAPFLTPVPFRGKKNRPEYVVHTYKFFAELRNIALQDVINSVHNNFSGFCSGK